MCSRELIARGREPVAGCSVGIRWAQVVDEVWVLVAVRWLCTADSQAGGHLGVVWVTYIRRALCALSLRAHGALNSAGQARQPSPMLQQRAARAYWILRRGRGEAAATEVFVTCSA